MGFIVALLLFIESADHDKIPFIICAYLESLIEKVDGCKNIPEKSSKIKVGKYIPPGFSMSTILSFKDT